MIQVYLPENKLAKCRAVQVYANVRHGTLRSNKPTL